MTTTNPVNIAIMGANGRMGRMLIASTKHHKEAVLSACFVRKLDAEHLPSDLPFATLDTYKNPKDIAVMIDFSLPEALNATLDFCVAHNINMVLGITGLSADNEEKLRLASEHIAIVYAGNYATGVNLALNLVATTAKALGTDADVEIIEYHHKHKKDAPSGTALMLAKAVTDVRKQDLLSNLAHGRHGLTPRTAEEIGMHAVRGGEIIGEHTVQFIMNGEIIEITHKAQHRRIFADGAVRAAIWARGQKAGLYDMQDVLGLKA